MCSDGSVSDVFSYNLRQLVKEEELAGYVPDKGINITRLVYIWLGIVEVSLAEAYVLYVKLQQVFPGLKLSLVEFINIRLTDDAVKSIKAFVAEGM